MWHNLLTTTPMFVCAIMTIQLVLEQRQRTDRLLRWLIAWGMAATLLYTGHYFYFNRVVEIIPFTDTIYITCNLLVYPLYLIYISELTQEHPYSRQPAIMALLLGPAAVVGSLSAIGYLLMDSQQLHDFIVNCLYCQDCKATAPLPIAMALLHDVCRVIFMLQVLAVVIIGIHMVNQYNHTISQLYADTDDKEAFGLTVLLKLFIITSLLSMLINMLGRYWFVGNNLLALPSLIFSALLFTIAWLGLHQRFSIRDIQQHAMEATVQLQQQLQNSPQNTETHTVSSGEELFLQFDHQMHSKRLFLQHDIRLDQIAQELGTNRTYLLQALNDYRQMTFKEYVNRLRIEYAEQIMEREPDILKSEVAIRAGYNNTSSFYRNYNAYHKKDTHDL